jgi:hypothetical protein
MVVAYSKYDLGTWLEWLRKVRIAGVPAGIRTKHLQNKSLQRYRYVYTLGESLYRGH